MDGSARGFARRGRADAAWPLLAIGALALGVVAWWAPGAGADTQLGITGMTANHFLFDDAAGPGADCVYVPNDGTFTVTVTGPYVLGLNRIPNETEQTEVSWRAVLLQNGTAVMTSEPRLGFAGDQSSADFSQPIVLSPDDLSGVFTVHVQIEWFETTGSGVQQLGTSTREIDFYSLNLEGGSGLPTIESGCRIFADPEPTETPVPTDTPEPTATETATAVPTATETPTAAAEPTATDTPAPTMTATPEPAATATETPIPTSTPTTEPTQTATATPTGTVAPTPTPTPAAAGPPRLTLSAPRGTVNSVQRVDVAGFTANAPVGVTFAGVAVATVTTNGSGSATATFVVSAKPQGSYEVRAGHGAMSAAASFAVAPRIKVTSGSGDPGDRVSVSLRGFGRNEPVRIRWLVDGRWIQVGFVERTSNTGSANVTVTIPAGADPGPASVRGDGTAARAQTNAFVVTE